MISSCIRSSLHAMPDGGGINKSLEWAAAKFSDKSDLIISVNQYLNKYQINQHLEIELSLEWAAVKFSDKSDLIISIIDSKVAITHSLTTLLPRVSTKYTSSWQGS